MCRALGIRGTLRRPLGQTAVMESTRPRRLRAGDTVAVLSPSWGGPHVFPAVFDAGLAVLREDFGLHVREYPTTRWSPARLRADPQARARDLQAAFADPAVAAVFASIGGDDAARLLPHLDLPAMAAHPKLLLGYSDTAALLVPLHLHGLVTFNGPAVMAGFAQLRRFPTAAAHVRALLFEPRDTFEYVPAAQWVDRYHEWNDDGDATRVGPLRDHDGWHWLQGRGVRSGALFGGCIEVLEFLKGSPWWPAREFWRDRVVFLETSEDCPTVEQVRYWLFNYGVQGVFEQASVVLFGRARGYTDEQKAALDTMIVETVAEFGATDLTVVTNMDFGHTDPQWILPLGARAEVDAERRTFRLVEPAVS